MLHQPDTSTSVPQRLRCANEAMRDGLQAAANTLPLAVSVFTYGIAYGALAHTANHLSLWQTLSMSIFVFAGASQFTVLAMLHQHLGMWVVVSGAFLLNARQILYGFSLGPFLREIPSWKLAGLSHGLTDESFSVTMVATQKRPINAWYLGGAGGTIFLSWLISSALGFAVGGFIGDPQKWGLDFAYIGAFLGLLTAQLQAKRQIAAALLSAVTAIFVYQAYGTTGAVCAGAVLSFLIGVSARDKSSD
ncbi:AzlC family ABC transporter permease [Alicyclobacillus sp. SO9]|uniref:AzlC family ABC transporter permease n=1 Tax=Alicyclobacillus sp. SO9 TaxID=2665646 RepID=UPI0018E8BBA6|nr:AzlC family ABC transporter permease [Alicyclobacillus sp. SO9]QQE78031.1 AzlC family ABC transporter permease [Alicyclobacillus sp. SO9]